MERHRERMELTLCGGKPWGFSIKGGTPTNKSITVSKLEARGKGEASGLLVGDIIICVNHVVLSGIRREAVELIRRAGSQLWLAVERAFPMNTIDIPTQERPSPFDSYNPDMRIRNLSPLHSMPGNFQGRDQQSGWHNERNMQNNNSPMSNNNQPPPEYVFTNNSNNKLCQKQHVKEALKMVIAEKRAGLVNTTPPDIIRDRLSKKTRSSMTSASTSSDQSEKSVKSNCGGVRHRHHSNKEVERPRSWHASKHPEIEQDLKAAGLSYGDRGHPAPRTRRKSREWLESGDLRSTLDRNSSESLLSSSSEQLLLENGEANLPQPLPLAHHRLSRDRSSITSNPSLLDAFQASPSVQSGSFGYESLHSAFSHRSSQDSLNSSSIPMRSSRMDCPSSDLKSPGARIERSIGNNFRSSGRYGEIWKLPQAHRRARSVDGLSDDTPRRGGRSRFSGSSQPESPAHKTDNVHVPLKLPDAKTETVLLNSPTVKSENVQGSKSPRPRTENKPVKSTGIKTENVPLNSPMVKSENVPGSKSPGPRTENKPVKSPGIKTENVPLKSPIVKSENLQGSKSPVPRTGNKTVNSPGAKTENVPLKSPIVKSENLQGSKSPRPRTGNKTVNSPGVQTENVPLKSPIVKSENLQGLKSPRPRTGNRPPVKSPGIKTENSPKQSPSPVRSRAEQSRFHLHRAEKGSIVDALISNFEKGSPAVQVPIDENKTDEVSEGRHFNENKSIVKHLQQHHYTSSSPNFTPRQRQNAGDKATSMGQNKYHVQSSGGGILSLYSEGDDYKTLQSRSDEYKKNIQGMSKKVLRVTSFTRKDLELSPPYKSPVHRPKGFGFPPQFSTKQDGPLLQDNGNRPLRSKSTSSLLDTIVPSMVAIPVVHEETNLLLGKQHCESPPPLPNISRVNTSVERPKEPSGHHEEVVESIGGRVIRRITGLRTNSLTRVPELHCEDNNDENQSPTGFRNHTNIEQKSLPLPQQEHLHSLDTNPTMTTPDQIPKVPIKSTTDSPAAADVAPSPVVKPSSLTTLPTTQPTPIPSCDETVVQTTVLSSSSFTSSSYNGVIPSSSPLPATSAYFQTSASKAKIIHLIQEKFEGGEIIDLENIETEEERNQKKIELLKRITNKLSSLQTIKDIVKVEVKENEQLGKTVKNLAEKVCSTRELEKFKTFVEEIDKIFNLIFSISGRLARVENTLATLAEGADLEEKNGLLEKEKKLTSQHKEAILLKENVDRRQENVSKILLSYVNEEEYADFEYYIKMKTGLISEQREVDDKMRLGEEQMRELHDSLPVALQEEYPLSEQYQAYLSRQSDQEEKGRGSD